MIMLVIVVSSIDATVQPYVAIFRNVLLLVSTQRASAFSQNSMSPLPPLCEGESRNPKRSDKTGLNCPSCECHSPKKP